MNKIINVNLGKLLFKIEEHAYAKLKKYLESISTRFKDVEGSADILEDIEIRIAEMFHEKLSPKKQAITDEDVEEVITKIGRPEDFGSVDEEEEKSEKTYRHRKIYRDSEDQILTGLASGLSYYFGVDPVWVRIVFVISAFLSFGTTLIVYIILSIIIPKAQTTTEKMDMRGEPINLDNIEKNIKATIEDFKKNTQDRGFGDKVKHLAKKMVGLVITIIKPLGKVLGVLLIIAAAILLFSLAIGGFGSIFAGILAFLAMHVVLDTPIVANLIGVVGTLILVIIPILLFAYFIVRVLFQTKNKSSAATIGTLSGLWIMGFFLIIISVVWFGYNLKDSATIKETEILSLTSDTLWLVNDWNKENSWENNDVDADNLFWGTYLNFENDTMTSSFVQVTIIPSKDGDYIINTNFYSRGQTKQLAKKSASKINYAMTLKDQTLHFSNQIKMYDNPKWRFQKVKVVIEVPVGKSIYLNRSMSNIIYDIDNVTNTYDGDMLGHYWLMTEEGLKCSDKDF